MIQWKRTVISIGLGAIFGIVLASVSPLASTSESVQEESVTRVDGSRQKQPMLSSALADNAMLAELDARLRAVEGAQRSAVRAQEQEDEKGSRQEPSSREQTLRRWNELLAAHDAETVDPQWVERWSDKFAADFEEISSRLGVAVEPPDCRSESCAITLAWPTYHDAVATWSQILHNTFPANCLKTIILDEPDDLERPYQARMLFKQCQDWPE